MPIRNNISFPADTGFKKTTCSRLHIDKHLNISIFDGVSFIACGELFHALCTSHIRFRPWDDMVVYLIVSRSRVQHEWKLKIENPKSSFVDDRYKIKKPFNIG